MTIADVNNDSRVDILTGNQNGSISVLQAQLDGTLARSADYPAGARLKFLEASDFNQDGFVDVVSVDDQKRLDRTAVGQR